MAAEAVVEEKRAYIGAAALVYTSADIAVVDVPVEEAPHIEAVAVLVSTSGRTLPVSAAHA